jgi:HAD superfamily hydrolase (TIGR01509 family)
MSDAYDAILFDLGGVLIELTGVETMLAWSPGADGHDGLWRRWLASPSVRRYESGRCSRAEFADAMVAEFALPVSPGHFLAAFEVWPLAVYAGADALLAQLRPRYRLASVSNTNELHWTRFVDGFGIDRHFDANFPSHQVGRLKPDAEYFEHVLAELAVEPRRTLFLDDNQVNVDGANAVGIHALRVAGVAGARAALLELGLLSLPAEPTP